MCACLQTGGHVRWAELDGAVLPIGTSQPIRGGEGGLPPHGRLREQAVLEVLFLQEERRHRDEGEASACAVYNTSTQTLNYNFVIILNS